MALFKARPSPFYVLDEVEAALDDVNLGRLIDIIEELRTSSQLIVITHQKRTMEIADALYGVSMRGDGVTQVIGQRLRETRAGQRLTRPTSARASDAAGEAGDDHRLRDDVGRHDHGRRAAVGQRAEGRQRDERVREDEQHGAPGHPPAGCCGTRSTRSRAATAMAMSTAL